MRIEVERREMGDYPKRDLTPEHTKRGAGHDSFSDAPLSKDVIAAYAYVDSVVDVADMKAGGAPAWHGWALREAFLAGVSHAENKTSAGTQGSASSDQEKETTHHICENESCTYYLLLPMKDSVPYVDIIEDGECVRVKRHLYRNRGGNRKFFLCDVCHAAVQMVVTPNV